MLDGSTAVPQPVLGQHVQPQAAGDLVEGLAGCIVQRLAEKRKATGAAHHRQLAVPAANQQTEEGETNGRRLLHASLQRMCLHVMDGQQRLLQATRQVAGKAQSNQQA